LERLVEFTKRATVFVGSTYLVLGTFLGLMIVLQVQIQLEWILGSTVMFLALCASLLTANRKHHPHKAATITLGLFVLLSIQLVLLFWAQHVLSDVDVWNTVLHILVPFLCTLFIALWCHLSIKQENEKLEASSSKENVLEDTLTRWSFLLWATPVIVSLPFMGVMLILQSALPNAISNVAGDVGFVAHEMVSAWPLMAAIFPLALVEREYIEKLMKGVGSPHRLFLKNR
jgi:hypothetical protein